MKIEIKFLLSKNVCISVYENYDGPVPIPEATRKNIEALGAFHIKQAIFEVFRKMPLMSYVVRE